MNLADEVHAHVLVARCCYTLEGLPYQADIRLTAAQTAVERLQTAVRSVEAANAAAIKQLEQQDAMAKQQNKIRLERQRMEEQEEAARREKALALLKPMVRRSAFAANALHARMLNPPVGDVCLCFLGGQASAVEGNRCCSSCTRRALCPRRVCGLQTQPGSCHHACSERRCRIDPGAQQCQLVVIRSVGAGVPPENLRLVSCHCVVNGALELHFNRRRFEG